MIQCNLPVMSSTYKLDIESQLAYHSQEIVKIARSESVSSSILDNDSSNNPSSDRIITDS